MKKIILLLFLITLICSLPISAVTVDIEYIGSIEDNLFAASSITVDRSSLTVLEPFSKEIKVFSPSGLLQQKLHINGDANSISKLSANEYLYCDLDAHLVTYIDISLDSQSDYFENVYTFLNPIDIILNDKISILDADAKQIIVFDLQKNIESTIQLQKSDGTPLIFPNSFVQNNSNNNYYVFDQLTSEISIFTSAGEYIKSFSSYGTDAGEITRGGEISLGQNGLIIVSDRYQNRVSFFSEDGIYLNMIPNPDLQVRFNIPTGIIVDENNILYVTSIENSRIQMFHLSSSTANAINMEQLRPLSFDTTQTSEIEFFASATTASTIEINAFDFEIFESDNSENVINASYDITPSQTFDSLQQTITYTAQWTTTEALQTNSDYQWRTRVHTQDSVYDWSAFQMFSTSSLPISFSLAQNYPNPFNPSTTIDFTLASESDVRLEIYNLNGQKVIRLINKSMPAGTHSVNWSGKNSNGQSSATGIYFYKLTAGQFVATKKMVLIK